MKNLALFVVVAFIGCGGGIPGETRSCNVTLSGALNGSYDCRPAITTWSPTIGQGAFSFRVAQTANNPDIVVSVGWPGQPTARHYLSSDLDGSGDISVTSGNQTWFVNALSGAARGGTYDLNFAGILSSGDYYNGKAYTTTGTLDASMIGNTVVGPLTLYVAF